MATDVTDALRDRVLERAYRLCEYCLVHQDDLFNVCEIDHIIGIKHGGKTVMENLASACFHCNRHKGSDVGSIAASGEFLRFFNPRIDQWSRHFYFSASGRIDPLTSIGEATCRILDFNHPDRVLLRRLLAEAGRYPSIEALARMKE